MKINTDQLRFDHSHLSGIEAMHAFAPEYQSPVGFIWYHQILVRHLNIHYIFVHPYVRRQRVASAMLIELRQWFPGKQLCTAVASDDAKPFLEFHGFRKNHEGWFLTMTSAARKHDVTSPLQNYADAWAKAARTRLSNRKSKIKNRK